MGKIRRVDKIGSRPGKARRHVRVGNTYGSI